MRSANVPRWRGEGGRGWYEAWFIVAADPRSGAGVWLRYALDEASDGTVVPSVWGSFFDRSASARNFSLKASLPSAAIRRGAGLVIGIGDAALEESGCKGEVEGGGHSLRWRLAFAEEEDAAAGGAQEVSPGFLQPIARLKKSGYLLARPALRLSGALEVDGQPLELRSAPGLQAHLWGQQRYPAWAWAHCGSFEEAPGSSLDLLSVQGPGGLFIPLFSFRFQGKLHRFAELPWIARSTSRRAPPAWHFSAEDATLAIDGALRADPADCVEVEYVDPDGSKLFCVNTEVAHAELRVRTRSFPGAPWRPEGTLRSAGSAGLEFCGPYPDSRVSNKMIHAALLAAAGR